MQVLSLSEELALASLRTFALLSSFRPLVLSALWDFGLFSFKGGSGSLFRALSKIESQIVYMGLTITADLAGILCKGVC
ncbi:hypothetical protein Ocin01_15708, partial [Orchesella cincta]